MYGALVTCKASDTMLENPHTATVVINHDNFAQIASIMPHSIALHELESSVACDMLCMLLCDAKLCDIAAISQVFLAFSFAFSFASVYMLGFASLENVACAPRHPA
jgi:hypothetical protein